MVRPRGLAVALLTLASCVACAGQAPLVPLPMVPMIGGIARPQPPLTSAKPLLPAEDPAIMAPPALTPVATPVAISLGGIGNPGPLELLASSASSAWVALCEADRKTARLVLGSGPGEPIDDLLAHDPSGRYVVSLREGRAELVDAVSGSHVDLSELGADVRRVRADYAAHRALSFDAHGQYLAYVRLQSSGSQIVVRKLDDGSEHAFAAGPGQVYRLQLSPDARYVTFDALREDTNHNGKLDWPAPEELQASACERPGLPKFRSFAYQVRGDKLTRAVLALPTGTLRELPELVTPLGASLLVREADGSLRLDKDGKRSALSPASCGARVLFADAERELVLATCAPPPPPKKSRQAPAAPASGKREVWLFGNGYAKSLHSELYETSTDREAVVGVRLVALYPGSDASLLDLERREVLPLTAGSRVVTTSGPLALIWREGDLYRYDALTRTEQRLAHGVLKNPDLLQAGSAVLLSPFVVLGCDAPALASPPHALALSTSGFVLTATPAPGAAGSAPQRGAIQGPLHWVDARLPPPDGHPDRPSR